MKKVIVIGSGFAGLSAAACLAASGFDVTVLEKNASPGGRARKFESKGFTFDMGPSWYWMPDVFEKFFARFRKHPGDYYALKRLDPSYRIYYGKHDYIDVPAHLPALYDLYETLEPGSARALDRFLKESALKYALGMGKFVYKPALSWRDLADPVLLSNFRRMNLLQSHARYVRRFFRHPRLIGMLEFPVLFLGAAPTDIPALYSLMNYADIALGTWHPVGGMHRVVDAMAAVARQHGVTFRFNTAASGIAVHNGKATGVRTDAGFHAADAVIAAADYRHIEQELLETPVRDYTTRYWDRRTLAPSCLIFFVGLNKRVKNLLHHTLFFDAPIDSHLRDIYRSPKWPETPQFYVCCPSRTDAGVAPTGCENLFILIPTAPGLVDDEGTRHWYYSMVMKRMEVMLEESLRDAVVYVRSYAHRDFIADYNAFRGNAYGLANTLWQTANFKPRIRSRKVNNLYFAGQFTAPGPGVPTCIISGQVVADMLIANAMNRPSHLVPAAIATHDANTF